MQPGEYVKMAEAESVMWWYRALHANLIWLIRRYAPGDGGLLDAGCGTGGLLAKLRTCFPGRLNVGVEFSPSAAEMAADKNAGMVAVGDVNNLPFAKSRFGAVVSADVLCHRRVQPVAALREAHRCLVGGGVCIVNVPAYEWLRSYHDVAVETARRFDREELRALLADAGFSVVYCGYWNTLLFPLMVLRRKCLPAPGSGSDVAGKAGFANGLFWAMMRLEHACMRHGLIFPFGGSCIAVGMKT